MLVTGQEVSAGVGYRWQKHFEKDKSFFQTRNMRKLVWRKTNMVIKKGHQTKTSRTMIKRTRLAKFRQWRAGKIFSNLSTKMKPTNRQIKKKTAEKNKTNKGYELFLRNYLLFQSFPSNVFFPDIIKTKCGNRQWLISKFTHILSII